MAGDMVKGLEEKDAALRAIRGGEELANDVVKMDVLKTAFSDSPEVMALAGKFATQFNAARGLIFGGAAESLTGLGLSGLPVYAPGHFGAEDSLKQLWHVGFFDNAEEAMTAPIPDSFMNAVGHAVTSPAFTYSLSAIP